MFLGHFSRSLRTSDLKACISAVNPEFCRLTFLPGDLRWPLSVLWSQSTENDTCKCQWHLYPCRLIGFVCLHIEIVLADVSKPEISNIPTLTRPVTSSSSRTGLSNGVWILEIGPLRYRYSTTFLLITAFATADSATTATANHSAIPSDSRVHN